MRLVMMTDMEGCAGINNFHDWVFPGGMFYDTGREILTEEVNAAARAFFDNGFEEILVLDAHGHGGVNILQLDERLLYQRGWVGPYPMGMTERYDALAFIGQHAKASTPFAHLAHTSSLNILDQRINGISIGEFGMTVFMAASLGIRPIYGSGDKAFCAEAKALCPNIHTTWVKEGLMPGTGYECTTAEYYDRNIAAVQLHPKAARKKIYEEASAAARAFLADPEKYRMEPLKGPFVVEIDYRTDFPGIPATMRYEHETDVIAALNKSWNERPASADVSK